MERWRVGGGLAPRHQSFLKIPVYMEVKQMGTLGFKQPHLPTRQPPKSPNTHKYIYTNTSMPSHHISMKKPFFHQLLQSHEVATFSATICPQSAHAACVTSNEVIPNNSSDFISYLKRDYVTLDRVNNITIYVRLSQSHIQYTTLLNQMVIILC